MPHSDQKDIIQKQVNHVILFVLFVLTLSGCMRSSHTFTVVAPAKHAMKVTSLVVQPFQVSGRQAQNTALQLQQVLATRIASEGYVQVLAQAPFALQGNLDVGAVETDSYTRDAIRTSGKTKKIITYHYYDKKLTITGSYALIERSSGRVITGDSIYAKPERTTSSESSAEAHAQLPTDEQMLAAALNEIAGKIIAAISPHQERVTRELQRGLDANIALGITYLENGRVDQAVAIWQQVIRQTSKPKDKAAAYYNIGVVEEARGNYKNAFEMYRQANALDIHEKLYMQAMTRVEQAQQEREKTYQQTR